MKPQLYEVSLEGTKPVGFSPMGWAIVIAGIFGLGFLAGVIAMDLAIRL